MAAGACAVWFPFYLHGGLWRDEAYTYFEVTAPSLHEFMSRLLGTEAHPPLFFLLMRGWTSLAGTSEIALRFPALLFSLLLVPVIYRLGTLAGSRGAGIVAAAFYIFAPQTVQLASEARPYSLGALLCTILVLIFLETAALMTWRGLLGIALVTCLFMYTHYVALPVIAVLAIVTPLAVGLNRKAIALVLTLFVGALPFSLWLPIFLRQAVRGVPWQLHLSFSDKIVAFGSAIVDSAPTFGSFAPLFVAIVVVCAFVAVRSVGLRNNLLVLLAFFLTSIAAETAVGAIEMRYAYVVLPIIWVFFASIICDCWAVLGSRLRSRSGIVIVKEMPALILAALGILLVFVPDTALALRLGSFPKSGIRSLLTTTDYSTSTVYLIAPDYLTATFAYYSRGRERPFIGFVRANGAEIFRVAGYAALWNDPQALPRAECAVMQYPSAGYSHLDYIVDNKAQDQGSVPYGKVWPLLRFLQTYYQQTNYANYPGLQESISEYRFSLSPKKHEMGCRVRKDGSE
jgi:uncharacterized membrane protein